MGGGYELPENTRAFLIENTIYDNAVKKAITNIGYKFVSATAETYRKRRFFA